jgi:DNA-binding NarL/FixJ family response regulator
MDGHVQGTTVGGSDIPGPIRLVVIDDHHLVAEALRSTLSEQAGIVVLGLAGTGAEGIALAVAEVPDVVLVDFRLPDMSGADVIRVLSERLPSARCVVLTGSGQDRALLESLDAGALGFVTKTQRFTEVVAAIRAAARGEASIPAALLGRVLPQMRSGADVSVRLTERERSVLTLMAAGKPNQEIGSELFISVNTVRNHVANLLSKLNARTRTEAVAIATREGLVAPGGESL